MTGSTAKRRTGAVAVSAIALAFALSSCAGPQAKVTIAGKQIALAVAFGKPKLPNPPKQPTILVPAPNGVGVVEVPADGGGSTRPEPLPSSTDKPAPSPCPTPAPGSAAAEAAPNTTTGVPKDKAVTFVHASRSTTTGDKTVTQVDTTGAITTGNINTAPGGAYTFDVGLRLFGVDSVSRYEVSPPAFVAPSQAAPTGTMSLSYVSGDAGLGYQQSFKPTTPLQVFAQPASAGDTWTSTSTDPTTQSVAQVSGKTVAEEPIAACGTVVDAWRTETVVHVTNPTQDIITTVTTWFATQHGGVPLAQTQNYSGTAGGVDVKGTTSWVVDADVWAG